MIPVAEAVARITSAFSPLPAETVPLAAAHGRVLAADIVARLTQPPFAVSAMDGYAARAADVADPPVTLRQIGSVPAGARFEGTVGPGETVRIFTGAPVPDGADTIVIQENTRRDGDAITVRAGAPAGRYIRPAGLDFRAGEVGVAAGRRLDARAIGLAAAMNQPWLTVRRRPRIALLATGDEIVMPGEPLGEPDRELQHARAQGGGGGCGGEAIDLGIARDDADSLVRLAAGADGADLLVTTGGASVGEHDLIRSALKDEGLTLDFWKIAMRPGKPLMFGTVGGTRLLGLPGNPVSSLVCALVFLRPALARMLGYRRGRPTGRAAGEPWRRRRGERRAAGLSPRHAQARRERRADRHALREAGQLDAVAAGEGAMPDRPPAPCAGGGARRGCGDHPPRRRHAAPLGWLRAALRPYGRGGV